MFYKHRLKFHMAASRLGQAFVPNSETISNTLMALSVFCVLLCMNADVKKNCNHLI